MQLKQEREVPKEVMFKLSDATQDPIKKNRYWFDFPSQWANQSTKDPIIGIRDMYLTKVDRDIKLFITVSIVDDTNGNPWLIKRRAFRGPLKNYQTLDNVTMTIDEMINDSDKNIFGPVSNNMDSVSLYIQSINFGTNNEWPSNTFNVSLTYDINTDRTEITFNLIQSISSDTNPLIVTDNIAREDGEPESNHQHRCHFYVKFRAMTDDAKAIFGFTESEYHKLTQSDPLRLPVWSRDNCYILSSLAEDDKNNFLGHTRAASYEPIKYYRLTNQSKKFWIELYESVLHSAPVSIPKDKKLNPNFNANEAESESNPKYIDINLDDLFIEAVVCFSSSGMI